MSDAPNGTTSQYDPDIEDDGPYIPGPILKRETDTIWEWRGDEDGNGEYVDTGRTPTASDRFAFALEDTRTPFLNMLRDKPETTMAEWGVKLPRPVWGIVKTETPE